MLSLTLKVDNLYLSTLVSIVINFPPNCLNVWITHNWENAGATEVPNWKVLLASNGDVFYGRGHPVKNLLTLNVGSIILSTTSSNATEIAQWADPSCSLPQPAANNGVRDSKSNWLAVTPTIHKAVDPEFHLHSANAGYNLQDLLQPVGRENATFEMPGQQNISLCGS